MKTAIMLNNEEGVFIGTLVRNDAGTFEFWPRGGPECDEVSGYSEELLRWIAGRVKAANRRKRKET